jgi:hypothetical protein
MCGPPDQVWPGGQPNPLTNHLVTNETGVVFSCRDHIMTAINAGYGAIYLTPPALMDFRNGTSVLEWSMSTQRTSSRDWIDVVIMNGEWNREDLQGPMALNMQDFHTPSAGLHIVMEGGSNLFTPFVFKADGDWDGCRSGTYERAGVTYCRLGGDGYWGYDRILRERYGLDVSASRRDRFRVEVSRTHLRVGYKAPPANAPWHWWVDTDIPGGLPFGQGVVQLNQRAYNPLKGCGPGVGDVGWPTEGWSPAGCRAGTWHWDDVSISPATPFTIIHGARRLSYPGGRVTFDAPAPPNSFLKFAAAWSDTEYSLDGGRTWLRASIVGPKAPPEIGDSYWDAVPAGTRAIDVRGSHPRWQAQDFYIYSRVAPAELPTPTIPPSLPTATIPPTPAFTATSVPTGTPTATNTPAPLPTATPTSEPTPRSTATPTAEPTATATPNATATPEPQPDGVRVQCDLVVRPDGVEAVCVRP